MSLVIYTPREGERKREGKRCMEKGWTRSSTVWRVCDKQAWLWSPVYPWVLQPGWRWWVYPVNGWEASTALNLDMKLSERDGLKVDSSIRSAALSAVELLVRGENDASIVGSSVTSKWASFFDFLRHRIFSLKYTLNNRWRSLIECANSCRSQSGSKHLKSWSMLWCSMLCRTYYKEEVAVSKEMSNATHFRWQQ